MLTTEQIKDIRQRSEPLTSRDLEQAILLYQSFIEDYTKYIGLYRDSIKLLESILEERVG